MLCYKIGSQSGTIHVEADPMGIHKLAYSPNLRQKCFDNYNEKFLVQADGHELEYIIHNFENIPMAKNMRVVQWTGDIAKFILMNL